MTYQPQGGASPRQRMAVAHTRAGDPTNLGSGDLTPVTVPRRTYRGEGCPRMADYGAQADQTTEELTQRSEAPAEWHRHPLRLVLKLDAREQFLGRRPVRAEASKHGVGVVGPARLSNVVVLPASFARAR